MSHYEVFGWSVSLHRPRLGHPDTPRRRLRTGTDHTNIATAVVLFPVLWQGAGADAADYLPIAVPWWLDIPAGIGNGLLLGILIYRSHLVPRPMALLGRRHPTEVNVRYFCSLRSPDTWRGPATK